MVRLSLIVLGLLAAVWCFTGAAEGKRAEACRDGTIDMYCYNGKKMRVTYIGYELGGKKCLGKPYPGYDYSNPCTRRSPIAKTVTKLCHGKRSCKFKVDTSVFKNSWLTCRGSTNVFLEVYYQCVWQM